MSVAGTTAQHTVAASDMELVRAARARDDGAFEELYRRYHGSIAGFVRRFVRDDGWAEDVAQEAFVSALRRLRQTECEIQFKPWIYEIARNAAIDHHRRRSRVQEVPFDFEGGLAAADNLRLTASAAPEASMIDKERFENFRGALDELSETQHRVIVLRELEGLSYREIGVRMQLSSAAVESALFRARRRLEIEYEQLDTGRRCALIRGLMGRLAEGVEPGGDRRRLERHTRRCWSCRRRAHQLGLDAPGGRDPRRRASALLPVPGFLRRLGWGADTPGPNAASVDGAARILATPAFETAAQGVHKAAVVLASAIALGSVGATLGGAGPLAIHPAAEHPAGTRDPGPAAGAPGAKDPGREATARPKERDGAQRRSPTVTGRPDGRRGSVSSPAPSLPFRLSMPRMPTLPSLPPPDAGRVPPASGVKVPTLPAVTTPRVPPAPQLPRLPDAPALPGLPAGAGVNGGPLGSVAPDLSGTTHGVPTPP